MRGPLEIIDLAPFERISYSWEPWKQVPETVATWTLEEADGKTRLTLVHSGFDPEAPNAGLGTGRQEARARLLPFLREVAD